MASFAWHPLRKPGMADPVTWKDEVKNVFKFLLLATLLSACGLQTNNSFSSDGTRFGSADLDPATTSKEFLAVRELLNKNCASCHAGFVRYTEAQWISNQYIVPGDPEASTLYRRLRGANVGGLENMPQGGALSSDERATFYSWIKAISKEPTPAGAVSAKARTTAALQLLATSCLSCHSAPRSANSPAFNGAVVPAFLTFTDDTQFVTSGLVVPGNTRNSWLMRSLKSWGDLNRMPKNGVALSAGGKKILEDWINGIGKP